MYIEMENNGKPKKISEMKIRGKNRCMEDGTGTQISPVSEFLKIY